MSTRAKTSAIPVSPSLNSTFDNTDNTLPEKPHLSGRVFFLSLQAVVNAIIIGVIAKVLVLLIQLITNIAFYKQFSFEPSSPAGNHWGWMVIFVPIIGSIIVGIMARFGSAAIRGHGIPEAMENIITNESKIAPIITFLKPISAAISIGTGGPFGAEGPIIATGGALGSVAGQVMRISASERKIMLAAGACAGMAAIFGSPVAAVMLAIELLLFEFSPRSIIPVALSCAAGAAMHLIFFGNEPVFSMPEIPVPGNAALATYVLMGAVVGVVASWVSKSVYWVEDMFEKLPVHWMWWPAIGAIAVGVIGYFAPHTMGVGYDNITSLLTGKLPVAMLLSLCLLKYLSWVISLGSGTSGGTLAPLFTIGGGLGALLGLGVLYVLPGTHINIATAALIGMAAMFAGASRAILTSIIFAFETTAQPHGLLPLLGACTAAYFVSFFMLKGSIMTEKILRRGVRAPDAFTPDVLQNINVGDVMEDEPVIISADNSIDELRTWSKENIDKSSNKFFVVADEEENFNGYVQREKLFDETIDENASVKDVMTAYNPVVLEDQPVSDASEIMGRTGMDVIAVLSKEEKNKIAGVITAPDILKAYSDMHRKDNYYHTSISLPRRTMRLIVRGRTLMQQRRKEADA
ncbi:chloride channel protein [Ilyomonas limi]|uniref:Chloride channel protein n=1 Tax=Ilyomonas limi TaxID=2575867 RepID=A0A4U3L708_9BACT|nr:chloride channel protein [Ilyomonas limi]TKK69407.1 chloride channel protein [Ilyomonas limi]